MASQVARRAGQRHHGDPVTVTRSARRGARALRGFALNVAGGRARVRVVLIVAAVLGLNGAGLATISAITSDLEHTFRIGNTGCAPM
jgi:hypothetical protein